MGILSALLLVVSTVALADPAPVDLLKAWNGCYRVHFHFREGTPNGDATDRAKEWLVAEEKDGVVTIRHTTIVDAEAEGDDAVIAQWKRANAEAQKTGGTAAPIVFGHLRETWEPLRGGVWKQTTYGPFAAAPLMQCSGEFVAQRWSCDVADPVRMLRRDRLKSRTDFRDMLVSQQLFFSRPAAPRPYVTLTQRNRKRNAREEVVAVEHGWIEYEKIAAAACGAAQR